MKHISRFETAARPAATGRRPTMGIIGLGAFGTFAIPHLAPLFDLHLHDAARSIDAAVLPCGARPAPLAEAAAQDVVVLAVPFGALGEAASAIAPWLRPGALVADVCSLKVKPLAILRDVLPDHVDIVGTHPLFGPQSGGAGVGGLRIAVSPVRGRRAAIVRRFLEKRMGLAAFEIAPEDHDREMAYVQGLTHLLSRILVAMEIPALRHTTPTFDHMMRMVESVRHDTDELYRTITLENPYSAEVRTRFLAAAKALALPKDGVMRRSRPVV